MTKKEVQVKISKCEARCEALLTNMCRTRDNPKALILRYDRKRNKLNTLRLLLKIA